MQDRRRIAAEPSSRVRSFLSYLNVERGLSSNTQDAYRRDLCDFEEQVALAGGSVDEPGTDDISAFLANVTRRGRSTKTVARRLAAIRTYLKYQAEIGQRPPADVDKILVALDAPKPERACPRRCHGRRSIACSKPRTWRRRSASGTGRCSNCCTRAVCGPASYAASPCGT